jgi:hypothetical protein
VEEAGALAAQMLEAEATRRVGTPRGARLGRGAMRVVEEEETRRPLRESCGRGKKLIPSRAIALDGSWRRTFATSRQAAGTFSATVRSLLPSMTCPSVRMETAPVPPSSKPVPHQLAPPRHPTPTLHRRRSSPCSPTSTTENEAKRTARQSKNLSRSKGQRRLALDRQGGYVHSLIRRLRR